MGEFVELSEHDQQEDAHELVRLLGAEGIVASSALDKETADSTWVVRVAEDDLPMADQVLARFLAVPQDEVKIPEPPAQDTAWIDYAVREPRAVFDFDCARRAARPLRPNRLVEVVAYATPTEADLIRERLASLDIHSCLGNEATVHWCWLFFTAIGGMRVFVMSEDRDRALDVIRGLSSIDDSGEADERWSCPHCDQSVPGDWNVCWACGTDREGVRDDKFEIASAPGQPLIEERFDGGPLPMWLVVLILCFPPVLLLYAFTKMVFYVRDATDIAETDLEAELHEFREREPRGLLDTVDDEPVSVGTMYDAIVVRATRAAVFGYLVSFSLFGRAWSAGTFPVPITPILTVYSMWLLHCRHRYFRGDPKSIEWRVTFAFALNSQLPIWIALLALGLAIWR